MHSWARQLLADSCNSALSAPPRPSQLFGHASNPDTQVEIETAFAPQSLGRFL